VPTAYIGKYNVMGASELLRLHGDGLVDFGSHTVDHLRMRNLDGHEMRRQAFESRRDLESLFRTAVRVFAYPYGQRQDFSTETSRVLSAAGYELAVTSCWGTRNDLREPLTLRRIFLGEHDDETLLRAKIEGGFDWRTVKERVGALVRSLQ
jgi:peptidoglycan/xylan/chitin deacetylase (PgdA/CDA1 family)